MCKHRGGFPEGQSPIVLDTLSNAEYNIKYLKKSIRGKIQWLLRMADEKFTAHRSYRWETSRNVYSYESASVQNGLAVASTRTRRAYNASKFKWFGFIVALLWNK